MINLLGLKVRPFLVRGEDGNMSCLFVQEAPFVKTEKGPTAPFVCFPPFNSQPNYHATRGRILIGTKAEERLVALGRRPVVLHALAIIIEGKIAMDAECTEVKIGPADVEPRSAYLRR